ncbi:hypothetical protein MWU62_14060 [Marinobacter sp. S6332]|nr:hypothetical protein [Marinobacter sp. S6332]
MFIIDDSGSMQFEVPEGDYNQGARYLFPPVDDMYKFGYYSNDGYNRTYIYDFDDNNEFNRYFRSSDSNPFFYNSAKTYEPWYKGDRSQWPQASPDEAYYFPGHEGSNSDTLDLTSRQQSYRWIESDGDVTATWKYYWPITYYVLKSASADPKQKDSYVRYQIRNGTGYAKDLETGDEKIVSEFKHDGGTRSVSEEIQNFANWFSYYRSRTLASRAGIGNAFSKQGEGMRVGYGRLNKGSGNVDGVNTSVIVNGVRLFKGSDREAFFNSLYTDGVPQEGTPLREALYRAGKYYERKGDSSPWAAEPGRSNSADHLECRQSFTILMTDGYRSGSLSNSVGNVDGNNATQIDDYKYVPTSPFKDSRSNTLADVAMHFWVRDLRDDLPNEVPVSSKAGNIDPAFWQHMVTFGVGLGVEGEIDAKTAFDAILDDSISVTWPSTDSDSGKVDDLLHAAVNGRGGFFNAADPDTFATKLAAVLSDIVSRVEESSTSAAASSAVLREDALSFSAGFRSTDWSGALQAAEILPGGARGRLIWDAEYGLESKGANGRNLYTYSAGAGVELKAIGNLSSAQESALNTATDGSVDDLGQARINWLRGDNAADSSFRDRLYVPSAAGGVSRLRLLGDVIGSDPQFAGKTNFGHRRLAGTEGSSYATYRASADYQDRPDVIYVGANDGYLHGFDSLTGEELFAYMPSELIQPDDGSNFAKINVLMESDYDHKYFVDGTPVIQDVYVDGQWKTILVGTMGVGGKTVFALDVSDPKNFSEADVLWEFTNSELGYGVESPQIAKLESGKWVAIFGNGYNSASNKSSLFVVDVSDGSLVARMDTGAGEADTPNGMSTPSVLVDQSTGLAKTAYVGDLLGNLWRADLTAGSLSAGSAISKLFSATSTDDTKQPITSAPSFARNPNGGPNDLVIVFGTGSYFRVTDSGDNQTQSLYGIFDNGSVSGIDRGDLLKQTITDETSTTYKVDKDGTLVPVEIDVRVVSAKEFVGTEDGWFMDLDKIAGERIVSSPSFPSGYPVERVRFSTLIPDNNDCGGGVDGYLMDMDLATGGQTEDPVFDLNRDGEFNESDNTVKNEKGESVGAGQGDGEGESSVVSGIRGVVSGEEIRVVLDNKTDLFVESVIVDLPNDYDGPVDPPTDPTPDDGDSEDPEDPEEPTTCQGPACGAAEGYNFGRQNWEELR